MSDELKPCQCGCCQKHGRYAGDNTDVTCKCRAPLAAPSALASTASVQENEANLMAAYKTIAQDADLVERLTKAVRHAMECDHAGTSIDWRCNDCENVKRLLSEVAARKAKQTKAGVAGKDEVKG